MVDRDFEWLKFNRVKETFSAVRSLLKSEGIEVSFEDGGSRKAGRV